MHRPFAQVDVFTTEPYRGNPVAVVLDASGLSDGDMQRFANWTNLSETTFVLPPSTPGADYRVRIFTPTLELPFAGHPTLGTCHAWLMGGAPHDAAAVVQECAAGLCGSGAGAGQLAFAAPPLLPVGAGRRGGRRARGGGSLGIDARRRRRRAWVDNGPGWVAVMLADADAVLARAAGVHRGLDIGVVGRHPDGARGRLEVRAFFPKDGATVEDPVTGSLNASLAQWLLETRAGDRRPTSPPRARCSAGRGRRTSREDEDGTIWVGGGTVTCVVGPGRAPRLATRVGCPPAPR